MKFMELHTIFRAFLPTPCYVKQPHRSYPQNPIIASVLYKTGFLESWGTGVSRMMEVCKAAGVSEPEYGTDGLFVWITFKRPIASEESGEQVFDFP